MRAVSHDVRSALWGLLAAAAAACYPVASPELPPSVSGAAITVESPVATPTQFSPSAATSTPLPIEPTLPVAAGLTPISLPTPTAFLFTPSALRSIQMMDAQTGWAMADMGAGGATHVLRTDDGGATWLDVSPVHDAPVSAYFLDAQLAWAWSRRGGAAWRTQDGGVSWTPVADFGSQPDVGFNDSLHGWKLNAEFWGLSFRQFDIISFSTTQDGGQTWQDATPPPNGGSAYMAYPSAQMAWAIRAGFAQTVEGVPNLAVPFYLQSTFDGGSTWSTQEIPLPPEATRVGRLYEGTYLGEVGNCEFVSPVYASTAIWKLALTCEGRSWLYTTANQGKTWIISSMPAGIEVQINFVNPTIGWLFLGGWLRDYQGDLYRTSDGGQSWTLIKHTGWGDVRLSFISGEIGWALACSGGYCYERETEKELVMTTDGGMTWAALEPHLAP